MGITNKHLHILEKAEYLFATKGYEGTTVRDIADAAGVNLAMISYYFGSKEKLMESLFKERMTVVRLKTETLVLNKSLSPFEKVEMLIDNYVDRVIYKQSFYKIMLCEQVFNKNNIVLKLLKELKFGYANLFTELISEGQKLKIFENEIDVMMLMNTMTGTTTQFIINKEYYKEYNQFKKMPSKDFEKLICERLKQHLKKIFKATLGYGK